MTKTVCDICGCDNPEYHCIVPMKVSYDITGQDKLYGRYIVTELKEIDLCREHSTILANFLNWLKTAKEGEEYNVL